MYTAKMKRCSCVYLVCGLVSAIIVLMIIVLMVTILPINVFAAVLPISLPNETQEAESLHELLLTETQADVSLFGLLSAETQADETSSDLLPTETQETESSPRLLPAETQKTESSPESLPESPITQEVSQPSDPTQYTSYTPYYTPYTQYTHLPIDITAIGRGEQPEIILSLRFFELDLFSANSQRINEAIAEQIRLNRLVLEYNLFETFESVRVVDINEQIAYAAAGLNLFAEPVSFGRIGQVETDDEIPLWITITVLSVCAVLGFVIARAVLLRKEDKVKEA